MSKSTKKTAPSHLNPGKWADEFVKAHHYQNKRTVQFWHDSFWCWDRAHPWYTRVSDREMLAMILTWLKKTGRPTTRFAAMDVRANVEAACLLHATVPQPSWLCSTTRTTRHIAMRNGLVDPFALAAGKKATFLPPTPEWFSPVYLPYAHTPAAKCDLLLDWLSRRMGDPDVIRFLQQFAGYAMTADYSRQCALLLQGDPGTGKSTFCRIMRRLVGPLNTSTVNLRYWGNPFTMVDVAGKTLNISDELPPEGISGAAETVFKEWVGGNPVECEPKGKARYQVEPIAKIVLAMNTRPSFKDQSGGIWRRWRIVKCSDVVDRDDYDPEIEIRMQNQIPGVFNWALAGLADYDKHGWAWVQSGEDELLAAREESQNHVVFIRDKLRAVPDGFLAWSVIWPAYQGWCRESGRSVFGSKVGFGRDLIRRFPRARAGSKRVRGSVERGFYNLGERK